MDRSTRTAMLLTTAGPIPRQRLRVAYRTVTPCKPDLQPDHAVTRCNGVPSALTCSVFQTAINNGRTDHQA